MRVDVVDRAGLDPAVIERDRRRPRRLPAVGPRLDHVIGVRGRAVAQELGVRRRAARGRSPGILEDQERRALAHDEPVAADVERPGRGAGRVVVTGRRAPG